MKQFFIVLMCSVSMVLHAQPFTNLAIEGGGVRGIAFAGALGVLDSSGILKSVRHVAGTSAGAVHAMMLATGFSSAEATEITRDMRFQAFNDGGFIFIGGGIRMGRDFGYYKGEALGEYLGQLLQLKTGDADMTFGRLDSLAGADSHYRHLYVVCTDLSYQKPLVISASNMPGMRIRDAVRASCTIPFYFTPLIVDDVGHPLEKTTDSANWHMLVDGGLVANNPFFVFDSMPGKTLGLRLVKPDRAAFVHAGGTGASRFKISNIYDYTEACYLVMLEHQYNHFSPAVLQHQTVTISTGNISPRIRRMKRKEVDLLIGNGAEAARTFLKHQKDARKPAK